MMGWIKIKYSDESTLPKNETEVLCYAYKIPSPKYNEMFVAFYENGKFTTGSADDYNNNADYFQISHWMPLPEKPIQ